MGLSLNVGIGEERKQRAGVSPAQRSETAVPTGTKGRLERLMADKNGLGRVGFFFGGITFAVTLIAFVVVQGHIEGRLALDDTPPQMVSLSAR
jgi:hypothetical protein